jgi:Putative auto-transporter adhesin, head GIN domain
MLVRFIAALLTLLALSPAHAAERSYLIGSFEDLIVEGDIQVILTTGKAPSAKASGDKERLSSLKIDRQGSVVRIRMQGLGANRAAGEPLKVILTGRDIRKLVLLGSGKITANDLSIPELRLEIRGSGEIDIASVKNERLVAVLVGSGKLTLGKGSVTSGEVTIDGSPVITTSGVMTDKLNLQQNGPATSKFTVKRSAEITNSGTGTITIDGTATCLIRQAGGAIISCAGKAGA